MVTSSAYADFFSAAATPVEGMLGGWGRLNEHLVLRGGVGTGLTSAVGSPLIRAVASIAYEPDWRREPEPEPRVAMEPPPPPEPPAPGTLRLQVLGPEGEPLDGTAVVTYQSVPELVELPERPATRMVLGGSGRAELPPGRISVVVDADGYRPADLEGVVPPGDSVVFTVPLSKEGVEPRAVLRKDRIEIREKVFFELDSFGIRSESFPLLREVAQIIMRNPEIRKLRIEGHTDSRGDDAYNLSLSFDRAEAVREFLVAQGVERHRLNAMGYGERQPLAYGEDEESWALNRRVDFIIEQWDDSYTEGVEELKESGLDGVDGD